MAISSLKKTGKSRPLVLNFVLEDDISLRPSLQVIVFPLNNRSPPHSGQLGDPPLPPQPQPQPAGDGGGPRPGVQLHQGGGC